MAHDFTAAWDSVIPDTDSYDVFAETRLQDTLGIEIGSAVYKNGYVSGRNDSYTVAQQAVLRYSFDWRKSRFSVRWDSQNWVIAFSNGDLDLFKIIGFISAAGAGFTYQLDRVGNCEPTRGSTFCARLMVNFNQCVVMWIATFRF